MSWIMRTSGCNNRPRILISANTVDKHDVGESWTAFKWIDGIREYCDVTLVTLKIKRLTPLSEQLPGVQVIEVAPIPFVSRWARFNSMAKPSFVKVYWAARRYARLLAHGNNIDLCHSLTPEAIRYPSPFQGLGIPFVHGPCGGSVVGPKEMGHSRMRNNWFVHLRKTDQYRFIYDRRLRRTITGATRLIVIGEYVARLCSGISPERVVVLSDSGIEEMPAVLQETPENEDVHILFAGRLVPEKGPQWMLDALSRLSSKLKYDVQIVGQGVLESQLRADVAAAGLESKVSFRGQLQLEDLHIEYQKADIFCFPSIEDASGCALLEAMSHGLACIVAGVGGPPELIDGKAGIVVPVRNREQFVEELAGSLQSLIENPHQRRKYGALARERIRSEYLWENKTRQMIDIYQSAIRVRG